MRINMEGLDEAVNALKASADNAEEVFGRALNDAGRMMQEEVTRQIRAFNVIDKGTLAQSVTYRVSGQKVEAWPAGKRTDEHHTKGERNETIAFVNEYGKKGVAGRPYMATAADEVEEAVAESVLDALMGAL